MVYEILHTFIGPANNSSRISSGCPSIAVPYASSFSTSYKEAEVGNPHSTHSHSRQGCQIKFSKSRDSSVFLIPAEKTYLSPLEFLNANKYDIQ